MRVQPSKYSLWLMPNGEVLNRLTSIIEELSQDQPGLCFEPHVTLLGGLVGSESKFITGTRKLASRIRPYEIHLDQIDCLDEFFRCLFIRVRPTRPVLQASQESRQIFGRQQDPDYLPHLSLMYGDVAPLRKDQIIARIGCYFNLHFKVRAIHLYATEGEPQSWYRVREFPIQ